MELKKRNLQNSVKSFLVNTNMALDPDPRKFRHEYKYLISAAQIPVLRSRICGLMHPDPHAGGDGMYRIRSVYFDDASDRCFRDNEIGVDGKAKYRIRIYNGSDARIRLELKEGHRGRKHKTSDILTRAQADRLLDGKASWPDECAPMRVLPGLNADILTNGMHPVIIVEYDRIPYIYRYGNVRVTFDLGISSSADIDHFFSPHIARRPIMPAGMHLMEVKFDEFLPDTIYRALQLENLRQTTFSKYYLCRIYRGPS